MYIKNVVSYGTDNASVNYVSVMEKEFLYM